MMILLYIGAMLIPDTPQEAGENPDNLTDEEAALAAESEPPEQGTQTYRCFLRTRKFWFVSLGVGIYMMVTVGVISQLILRLTSIGLSRSAAMSFDPALAFCKTQFRNPGLPNICSPMVFHPSS